MISQGRIKIGKISIALLMLLSTVILNAVAQTELKNDKWQLIGFMGPQGSKASVSYRQDINREVIDIADENTTYLVKEDDTTNGQLAYKTGLLATDLSTTYTGATTQIGSSIGIFAIKNSRSPSGETTLTSTISAAVKIKISNSKQFIVNLPKYRMYLEGKGNTPAVRIDYQADYEGQQFKIKFGNETKDYIGYFSYSNTFMTPAVLQDSSKLASSLTAPYFAPIQDAIDFNINDNNITRMVINNEYTIKDTAGVYNKDLTDYASSPDYQVTVYRFSGDKWEHFDSRNAKKSSNDFDRFDTGRGYWVKTNNERTVRDKALNELTPIRTGLISSSVAILDDNPYKNVNNGWSLLAFANTNIRYAPSGVFIPQNVWKTVGNGIQLFFKSEGRSDGALSGMLELGTSSDNNYSDSNSAARAVNLAMQINNDISSEFQKIRAVPAIDFSADYATQIPGIMIISDGLFELNTSGNTTINAPANQVIKTIAKGSLKPLANGNYGSVYGEYMNFMKINPALDATPEVNASLAIYVHNGKSSAEKIGGLNDGNNTNRLRNILTAFATAATKNGATTPYTNTAGYLTSLDFTDTDNYNNTSNMTHMLIASGERYSISDSTFTKVYKYKASGRFSIISSKGTRSATSVAANAGATAADNLANMQALVVTINGQTVNTGVSAISLGTANGTSDAYFAIMSVDKGLELLENAPTNLFEDVSLTNGSIPNSDRVKGPVTSVHSTNNLFDTSIIINRDVIDGNASYFGIFDLNFTKQFEDNKSLENNVSVVIGSIRTAWATQTIYLTNSDVNLTGTHLIGGDLIIENSTLRVGALSVGGRIITIGDVIFEFNQSATIKTGIFNKRESNATTFTQLAPASGTLTFSPMYGFTEHNLSTSIDINGSKLAYDNNLTLNSVDLEKNVSNIAVGRFNLNGADFPSINNDLKSDSHWVLDFPLQGGIIEDFSENYNKKIKSILTMNYSSGDGDGAEAYWVNTDLTKNIDTLYGNSFNTDNDVEFDNDYQGIFRVQPNKAYWVNLENKATQTKETISSIINTQISKVTDQASAHFSNTFDDNRRSVTQNHINHQLNIMFTKLLNKADNAYYNVVAIIAGKRYYLKRNGNIFNLAIDDNEMALKPGTPSNQEIPIFLEVYDGTGTKIEENASNNKFSITFYKPTMPIPAWDKDTGKLKINGMMTGSKLELYANFVSDIESERDKKKLKGSDLSDSNITALGWEFDANTSLHGGVTPIRMMVKSVDGFYSDMTSVLYAPIDKGHVLVADVANPQATLPFSYLEKQYLTKRDPSKTGINFPKFVKKADGSHNGVNGGVQLNLIPESIEGKDIKNNNIQIAYYPNGVEGTKGLLGTGFGGSEVMYIRVNTGGTGTDAIASISYLPGYKGKIFYIYFNGKLYQGRFASTNAYSNDGNAYNLEGSTDLTPSAFINGTSSQAIIGGTSGVVIKSALAIQPILIRKYEAPKGDKKNEPKKPDNTPDKPQDIVTDNNKSQLPK